MIRNVLAIAFLTATTESPVWAEPIPLLEMKWQILANEGDGPVPATATFSFGAGDGFGFNYLGWVADYGPSDVGKSFWAPMDVIDGANIALTDSRGALYTLVNGPANHATFSNSDFLSQEPSTERPCPGRSDRCVGSAVYVDDLESYRVTAVERQIDYLSLTRAPFGDWIFDGSQSIRYWGTLIPEPGSAVLLSMAIAHLCLSFRQRRRR
jgi:hypothetical protein